MIGPTFELRRCCPPVAPDDPAQGGFIETAGAPSRIALGAPIRPADPPRPDRAVCWHESGHSAVIHLAGGRVAEIVVAGSNPVCRQSGPPLSPLADAVMLLAGPAAEGRARGFTRPEADGEVAASWRRVNFPAGGRCDACVAMRAAVHVVGLDRESDATRLYRAAERLAHEIAWHPEVERVIRIATHALMCDGRMSGERFHEIAGEVIAPETINHFRKELEECWQSSKS